MMQSDMEARRGHAMQGDLLNQQQGHQLEQLDHQHQYALEQATHGSHLRINEMGVQHQFNTQEIAQKASADMARTMAQIHGQAQLESARAQRELEMFEYKIGVEAQMVEDQYNVEMQRIHDSLHDPESQEYQIRVAELNEQRENMMHEIISQGSAEFLVQQQQQFSTPLGGTPPQAPIAKRNIFKEPIKQALATPLWRHFTNEGALGYSVYDDERSAYDSTNMWDQYNQEYFQNMTGTHGYPQPDLYQEPESGLMRRIGERLWGTEKR